jgi:hypothetical protein
MLLTGRPIEGENINIIRFVFGFASSGVREGAWESDS